MCDTMDGTAFRILVILARNLGRPTSINGLRAKTEEYYGTGFYKNIHDKVQELVKEGIIKTETIGKSSIISLNFSNPSTVDSLTEMELSKKQLATSKNNELQMILTEIGDQLRRFISISSISLTNPEEKGLNRIELLVITRKLGNWKPAGPRDDPQDIPELIKSWSSRFNIKIDALIIKESDFFNLLVSKDYNPIKPMISNQLALLYPQNYWLGIKDFLAGGMSIQPADEINPAKMTETDMEYNLARFGYKELGSMLNPGKGICLESVIVSILIKGDARKIEAIPVLLAKNNVNYSMLIFLARKYKQEDRLLGLLNALSRIKKLEGVHEAIAELKGVKEKPANEKAIREKLRLYNGN